jgi:hypothetical protein
VVSSLVAPSVETLSTRLLALGESAAVPWEVEPGWFVVLALILPVLSWIALAWKQALDADPNRVRRRALRELKKLTRQGEPRHRGPDAQLLNQWLRSAAGAWGSTGSAPTAEQLLTLLRANAVDDASTGRWRALWQEAEHALYSADGDLPDDWIHQAAEIAEQVEEPERIEWWPNRIRYWLPSVATVMVIGLGLIAPAVPAGAVDFESSAAEVVVDSEGAREAAMLALAADWTDWAAHQNMAIVHLLDARWEHAAAEAASAFLLNPGSDELRELLRFCMQQIESPDRTLRHLATATGYASVPARLSVAKWQRLALAAALLLASGLSMLVGYLYFRRAALTKAGAAAAASGAVLLTCSLACIYSYGALARPDAGIVLAQTQAYPVPTELSPEEQMIPLAPGTIVALGRPFLAWNEIDADGDVRGWVRRQVVLPIYRPSP